MGLGMAIDTYARLFIYSLWRSFCPLPHGACYIYALFIGKMLALLNGGAAVAVLTYLGNLVSRSQHGHIHNIRTTLCCFWIGLVATMLAFVCSYLTQLRLYGEDLAEDASKPIPQHHKGYLNVGLVLGLVAVFAFGVGCWFAASMIAKAV
jgi:hypothetical protein